ncbi:MAG: hypothetical protein KGR68_14515 [Betaproteobacteria bacterium]|nr:hypothetical protein [Betaproteobacteria bacterium]
MPLIPTGAAILAPDKTDAPETKTPDSSKTSTLFGFSWPTFNNSSLNVSVTSIGKSTTVESAEGLELTKELWAFAGKADAINNMVSAINLFIN